MHGSARLLLVFVLGAGAVSVQPSVRLMASPVVGRASGQTGKAALKPAAASAPDIPFKAYEFEVEVEEQLLALANQSRHKAGAPPLALDAGLSEAARIHAQAMLQARQLSHQFNGEAQLATRLAATTELQLDREGENVALDYDAERGHQHL